MATDVNLDSFDMAFPSSAPAAEKIAEKMSGAERYDVFYTPMAIATFDNILQALERENVARQQGTTWQVDMAALATTYMTMSAGVTSRRMTTRRHARACH